MAESTRKYSIFQQQGREPRALPAQVWSLEAFLITGIWALRRRLWLNAAAFLCFELFCLIAIVWLGGPFLIPLIVLHAYCGLGAYSLLARDLKNQGYHYSGEVEAANDITAISRVKGGELQPSMEPVVLDFMPQGLKPMLGVAHLTWKAAFRYKFFWVMSAMLLVAVVALPMILQDDGTPQSLIHILITYTLAMTTTLLGVSTLWLACGTLARDVEECQMQMVATKPIPRWQIWLGKWLGVMSLNAALLALSGAAVYGMLHYRLDQFVGKRVEGLQHEPQSEINKLAWLAGMWTNRPTSLPHWAVDEMHDLTVELKGAAADAKVRENLTEYSEMAKTSVTNSPLLAMQFWGSYLPRYMNRDLPVGFEDKLRQLVARLEVDKAQRKFLVGRASVQPILEGYEERATSIALGRLYDRVNEEHARPLNEFWVKLKETLGGKIQAQPNGQDFVREFSRNPDEFMNLLSTFMPADVDTYGWWDQSRREARAWMESVPVSITDNTKGTVMIRGTRWDFKLPGARDLPADTSFTLRFKLEVFANTDRQDLKDTVNINLKDRVFPVRILIGDMNPGGDRQVINEDMTIRTFHEFEVYPSDFSEDGDLTFQMMNLAGQRTFQTGEDSPMVSLSIPFWNGELELLYTESSFAVNYLRGLLILFCWLGLLAALGLAFASFMSFPFAAFTCVSVLIIAFSTPLMHTVIDDGTIIQGYIQNAEGSFKDTSFLDWYAIPMFKFFTFIISPLTDYSPVQDLSEGRSITWGMLARAYLFVWGVGGMFFVFGGMLIFHYRELALPQSS